MSTSLKFDTANVRDVSLAKVGNKLNGEELVISEALCALTGDNEELITEALLKRFKNLERQVFFHKDDLEKNVVYQSARTIFGLKGDLLTEANTIAKHLFNSTKDPSVKPGDLCIATIDDVDLGGSPCKALCIVKSETSIPVIEIAEDEDGLELKTHNVISPDKMQKGALILAYQEKQGFAVFAFDKSGGDLNAWQKDFLSIKPHRDADFMTKNYTELAVAFAQEDWQIRRWLTLKRMKTLI